MIFRKLSFWILTLAVASTLFLYNMLAGDMVPPAAHELEGKVTTLRLLMPYYSALFWQVLLIGITLWLTRRREPKVLATDRSIAKRETLQLLVYGIVVMVGGQVLGRLLGTHGIGLHLPGSLYQSPEIPSSGEVVLWMGYNFFFFAAIPYWWFRRRGYSHSDLFLSSSNVKNDILVIFSILALESLAQLFSLSSISDLSMSQAVLGSLIAFFVYLFGTGLPVLVLIYALLVPRYQRLTNSLVSAVILGGVTYAGFHIFEHWTLFDSWQHAFASAILVFLQFIGPGMIKSVLTLRTGNAWVHLWAYHAIAPHVIVDAVNIVKIFKL